MSSQPDSQSKGSEELPMPDSKKPVRDEQQKPKEDTEAVKSAEVSVKRGREGTEDASNGEECGDKQGKETAHKKLKTEKASTTMDKSDNITEEVPNQRPEDGQKDTSSKPKHVFGSATTFGSGFAAARGSPATAAGSGCSKYEKSGFKPSAFGSGLSFGGGFTMLKKTEGKEPQAQDKSPSDPKEKDETLLSQSNKEQSTETESAVSSSESSGFKLQKQEVKSGEESEEVLYQVNAKLYQLIDLKEGWKERGVGVIKVNKNTSTAKARLVMRSRGILKVILNLPLVKGFKIQQGFPGSLQSEKFIRITAVDDNKAPLQYAVKTGKQETVQELYEHIVKLVPEQ